MKLESKDYYFEFEIDVETTGDQQPEVCAYPLQRSVRTVNGFMFCY